MPPHIARRAPAVRRRGTQVSGRRERGCEQLAIDAPAPSRPVHASSRVTVSVESRCWPSCAERLELVAERELVDRSRAVDHCAIGTGSPLSSASTSIERQRRDAGAAGTSSIARLVASGGSANVPNGPSTSRSVPWVASSRCGSGPPLSSTWTSELDEAAPFGLRGRRGDRIRLAAGAIDGARP